MSSPNTTGSQMEGSTGPVPLADTIPELQARLEAGEDAQRALREAEERRRRLAKLANVEQAIRVIDEERSEPGKTQQEYTGLTAERLALDAVRVELDNRP